jgi:hypothetical protein
MPVNHATYTHNGRTITKPVYVCEVCGKYASFGIEDKQHSPPIQRWYCKAHKETKDDEHS